MGQHGSLLGKDGSAHDFFRARLDALVEEEDRLLTETISLGNTKSDVARKKVLQTKIDEIQARTAAS
jgi:hypothetical protein